MFSLSKSKHFAFLFFPMKNLPMYCLCIPLYIRKACSDTQNMWVST